MNETPGYAERHRLPVDKDDQATWTQLRDRLREIRGWAENQNQQRGPERFWAAELLAILNRPRETDE